MTCCGTTTDWKREEVPDHKFSYVDLDEYPERSCLVHVSYSSVFLLTFKSVLFYIADFLTAVFIAVLDQWSGLNPQDIKSLTGQTVFITTVKEIIKYVRYIYPISIAVSFLLLFFDVQSALKIIRSRDISFAYTNTMAGRYYTLRSYAHYCFFRRIDSQRKFSDRLAFFVFFRLKGWKRLLFAETPRQAINLLILWVEFDKINKQIQLQYRADHTTSTSAFNENDLPNWNIGLIINYFKQDQIADNTLMKRFSLLIMLFVFAMWTLNVIMTLIATFLYVPLLCRIRGNLKEYVCFILDKRIGELMQKKAHKRILKNQQQIGDSMISGSRGGGSIGRSIRHGSNGRTNESFDMAIMHKAELPILDSKDKHNYYYDSSYPMSSAKSIGGGSFSRDISGEAIHRTYPAYATSTYSASNKMSYYGYYSDSPAITGYQGDSRLSNGSVDYGHYDNNNNTNNNSSSQHTFNGVQATYVKPKSPILSPTQFYHSSQQPLIYAYQYHPSTTAHSQASSQLRYQMSEVDENGLVHGPSSIHPPRSR